MSLEVIDNISQLIFQSCFLYFWPQIFKKREKRFQSHDNGSFSVRPPKMFLLKKFGSVCKWFMSSLPKQHAPQSLNLLLLSDLATFFSQQVIFSSRQLKQASRIKAIDSLNSPVAQTYDARINFLLRPNLKGKRTQRRGLTDLRVADGRIIE